MDALAATINGEHGAGAALAVPCDLADAGQIEAAFGRVRAELGFFVVGLGVLLPILPG